MNVPFLRIAAWISAALLLPFLLAFLGQRNLIYFPESASLDDSFRQARGLGLEPWHSSSGALLGWRAPHPSGAATHRLLVLHGNAGTALDRIHFARVFQAPRVIPALDVYLLEYPGYGPMAGSPSERALVAAALAGVAALADKPLLLVGESLGGAVACLAAERRPGAIQGLILIAPLKNLPEVGKRHYPFLPSFLLRDEFRADRALAACPVPASFLIPGRDEVVFTDLIEALRSSHAGPHRTWVEPSATHNGITFDPAAPRWAEMVSFSLGATS
jgi:hypothetical protein